MRKERQMLVVTIRSSNKDRVVAQADGKFACGRNKEQAINRLKCRLMVGPKCIIILED